MHRGRPGFGEVNRGCDCRNSSGQTLVAGPAPADAEEEYQSKACRSAGHHTGGDWPR